MARLSVLIVDDSVSARRLAAAIAEIGGAEIVEAEDGEEALSKAPGRFDLILSDIDMPRLDGFGLFAATEGGAFGLPRPKFVFVSGHLSDQDMSTRAELARVDGALAKPYHPAELFALIETLFPGFGRP
jgi:two-component system, chemotaxis family, chemotaxis protein CheY